MVSSTKTRCLQCGSPVNPQAQFCEHCGSAVARSPLPRTREEDWEEDMENPTVQEVRLPRPRPASPAVTYKFEMAHLVSIGLVGAAIAGVIALLSAVVVLVKGHTIGAGLCMIAAAFAFGLLALSGGRKS